MYRSVIFNQGGKDSPVWKVGKLNHVAIAVPDIDKAAAMYRDVLGAKVSEKVVSFCSLSMNIHVSKDWKWIWIFFVSTFQAQPEHGVYTVFVELDNTKIEVSDLHVNEWSHRARTLSKELKLSNRWWSFLGKQSHWFINSNDFLNFSQILW